jgi:DNA-3-methyladenine glycosylase
MPEAAAATEDPFQGLKPWTRRRFAVSSEQLARDLIGALLVRRLDDGRMLAGRIVETEAYLGARDRASHAFGGRRTERNESMYAQPGTAYVYFTYGMHFCFNVVCGTAGDPLAVLVRAAEPVAGVDHMTALRAVASKARHPHFAPRDLCRGPARLCQAMAIRRDLNGLDLATDPRLFVADAPGIQAGSPAVTDKHVVRTARIGVDYAGAWAARRLRWLVAGHPCVSVPPRPTGVTPRRRARGA